VETSRVSIVIASPLEAEQVARIAAAAGDRAEVIHALDLLPPARYVADHDGPEDFSSAGSTSWRRRMSCLDCHGRRNPIFSRSAPGSSGCRGHPPAWASPRCDLVWSIRT
jgi:hypothetical protein